MSTFKVPVTNIIEINPHPNADSIELAKIAGYNTVVAKGQFKPGDLVVYLPEQAVLPENIIEILGLQGRLAGSEKNRVKIIKLRGEVSQGIVMSLDKAKAILEQNDYTEFPFKEGDDLASMLGVTKWEPPIPTHMAGDIANVQEAKFLYDIENLQNFPDVFTQGEKVIVTEKIHGTFCGVGYIHNLNHPEMFEDGCCVVFSKGLGSKGFMFKNNDKNKKNIYVKTAIENKLFEIVSYFAKKTGKDIYIFGEIFGKGVQDLHYGSDNKQYRLFDLAFVETQDPSNKTTSWLSYSNLMSLAENRSLKIVPLLNAGDFDLDTLIRLRDGKETISGNHTHIREGIVITDDNMSSNRRKYKFVSPDYLLRKGETTEFN